jgi:predicted PurR-regulated permease PerM
MSTAKEQRRLILYGITMAIVAVLIVLLLFMLRRVLLVLYVSTLLAIGFSPAVHWLERQRFFANRKRLPRWAAILVLYVGALGIFALLLSLILPPLFGQLNELRTRTPIYLDLLQNELVRFGVMDPSFTWGDLVKRVQTPGVALSNILGAVQSVLGAIGTVITVLLLPFYFLVEASTLQIAFLHLFAKERRPRIARITAGVTLKVGAWLSGQLLLGAVIGTTAAIGLWIIGVPYFYVLGLVAAVGEMIPVVGPIMAAVPAIFMGWTVSGNTALIVAAYFAVQQFFENNLLVPRIMERQVGVSAVTVLVALLIGSELLGIVGALLAVPSAAIVQVLIQEFVISDDA